MNTNYLTTPYNKTVVHNHHYIIDDQGKAKAKSINAVPNSGHSKYIML